MKKKNHRKGLNEYNEFIYTILEERHYELGVELNKLLSNHFSISDSNARKILSRSVTAGIIKSSKPNTFGNGQYLYFLKGYPLNIDQLIKSFKIGRPPIYRLLSELRNNDGIISYYEALKITASPEFFGSSKVNSLQDILTVLVNFEIIYLGTDIHNIKYIIEMPFGEVLDNADEQKKMRTHYEKMVMDCNLIPDILRWLISCNLIDNSNIIYRNKKTPSIGAKHNNLVWDAFGYTKTTGINSILGSKATSPEKQTLVVLDILLSKQYSEIHLDGFLSRVQININSVKNIKRKVVPIVVYRDCTELVLNRMKKLGFLAFDIGSFFGVKIYSVIKQLGELNTWNLDNGGIESNIKAILKSIRSSGQEAALRDLKGVLFEVLMYPLLTYIYPNSEIERGKTLRSSDKVEPEYYEYDYIIKSNHPSEIIIVELKGYSSSSAIPLGDIDKKASLKWFFNRTVQFAKRYFKNEVANGKKIKAVYITSANFWEDSKEFLNNLNKSNLKPANMNVAYDRAQLINLLKEKEFNKEVEIIEKYYIKDANT